MFKMRVLTDSIDFEENAYITRDETIQNLETVQISEEKSRHI